MKRLITLLLMAASIGHVEADKYDIYAVRFATIANFPIRVPSGSSVREVGCSFDQPESSADWRTTSMPRERNQKKA